jgi:hypothetical protein
LITQSFSSLQFFSLFFLVYPSTSTRICQDFMAFPPVRLAAASPKNFQVSEACVFRATTHHSDGVDIHLKLTGQGGEDHFERFWAWDILGSFIMDVS